MPMYPTAYLVSPFQYPTGNTNLSCPQIHLSSTSPKLVLFASPTLRNSINMVISLFRKQTNKKQIELKTKTYCFPNGTSHFTFNTILSDFFLCKHIYAFLYKYSGHQSLSWWLSGKKSTSQCRRCGFNCWIEKIPWRRKWQTTPVFLPGKSHGQRSLAGYSSWGCKESDMT